MKKKNTTVELLAPAGSYEGFLGSVHAGADAVYLGGSKFGARAYADNFTQEEIIQALSYAHVHGKKVYLTLNTLIKEREFGEIYDYLLPFYLEGLDAVIIQDLGIFYQVGEWFPDLERHVSTQMAVTGSWGAKLLKEMGAARIVPARELSLNEIIRMKKAADIEIESFVHGAMCYSYSGQCIFSSLLGGRSGNRGRCAQPCRLPYQVGNSKKESYPLSLKDMCTLEMIPALIDAGIDSFKIEGRMKSPEYAAGVTSIYRKYIDLYLEHPEKDYHVCPEDLQKLRSLYMRSEISQGYYHQRNGKTMITLDSPSYRGRDEALSASLRKEYLEGDFRLPVRGWAEVVTGEKISFTIQAEEVLAERIFRHSFDDWKEDLDDRGETLSVTVYGEAVQTAVKQPITEEQVIKQLGKTGNTPFVFQTLEAKVSSDAFLPVKQLNELRRLACELFAERLIEVQQLPHAKQRKEALQNRDVKKTRDPQRVEEVLSKRIQPEEQLHVSVLTLKQLEGVLSFGDCPDRIYLSADLWEEIKTELSNKGSKKSRLSETMEKLCGLPLSSRYLALPFMIRNSSDPDRIHNANPDIIQNSDDVAIQQLEDALQSGFFSGVLVRCLEELGWLKALGYQGEIVADAGLYVWNHASAIPLADTCREICLPYELNIHELRELTASGLTTVLSAVFYGRLPMMVTANCIARTEERCRCEKGIPRENMPSSFLPLTDRYQKVFPVLLNCRHCSNIIYNSLPLSLHGSIDRFRDMGVAHFRLDFTTEDYQETEAVLTYFRDLLENREGELPYQSYTKGHLQRGVE